MARSSSPVCDDHHCRSLAALSEAACGISPYNSVRWQVETITSRSIRGSCRAAARAVRRRAAENPARSRISELAVRWLIPRQSSLKPDSTADAVTKSLLMRVERGSGESCQRSTCDGIRAITDSAGLTRRSPPQASSGAPGPERTRLENAAPPKYMAYANPRTPVRRRRRNGAEGLPRLNEGRERKGEHAPAGTIDRLHRAERLVRLELLL